MGAEEGGKGGTRVEAERRELRLKISDFPELHVI